MKVPCNIAKMTTSPLDCHIIQRRKTYRLFQYEMTFQTHATIATSPLEHHNVQPRKTSRLFQYEITPLC